MDIDKDISHVHVLDAFEKSRACPICELNNAAVVKYMDGMLYESVNDPALRKKIANSKGLCPFHGELLIRHGDALGIAILHIEQIQMLLDHIKGSGNIFNSMKHSDPGGWLEHSNCVICNIRNDSEKRHIATFIELIDDREMRSYLDSFPGLCARHLLMVLAKLKNEEHIALIVELHSRKYGSLMADLREFCRKNDYRFKDEPMGQEAESWKKAVYIVSGKIL